MIADVLPPAVTTPAVELAKAETALFLLAHRQLRLVHDFHDGGFWLCGQVEPEAPRLALRTASATVALLCQRGLLAFVGYSATEEGDLYALTAEGWRSGRRGHAVG